MTMIPIVMPPSACSHQRIGTGTGGLGNKRMSGDHPNYSIVEKG